MKTLKQHLKKKEDFITINNRFESHSIYTLSITDIIEAVKEWLQEHMKNDLAQYNIYAIAIREYINKKLIEELEQ